MKLAIAVAGALLLAGCPIPQPLPEYEAGTITPPRIVMDDSTSQIAYPGTVVLVAPEICTTPAPSYPLSAALVDVNTIEQVSARWFVNYDPEDPVLGKWRQEDEIPGVNTTPPQTRRAVPTFTFYPYANYGRTVAGTGNGMNGKDAGAVQIVELLVSNGFDPTRATPDLPPGSGALLPYRSPALGFETQMFRWVFVTTPSCP